MASITQYQFSLQELTKILIREQGITEGYWVVGVQFGHAAGDFAQGQAEPLPSMIISVGKINLVRVEQPTPHSVDAATVNAFPMEIAVH